MMILTISRKVISKITRNMQPELFAIVQENGFMDALAHWGITREHDEANFSLRFFIENLMLANRNCPNRVVHYEWKHNGRSYKICAECCRDCFIQHSIFPLPIP